MDSDHGIVGIVKVPIEGHRAKIGYVVHQPFSGRGVATEAVRQAVAVVEAMPNISRVWATCATANIAPARVLEKCGFHNYSYAKVFTPC